MNNKHQQILLPRLDTKAISIKGRRAQKTIIHAEKKSINENDEEVRDDNNNNNIKKKTFTNDDNNHNNSNNNS